jgi:SAM-dependent methyltransferase
MKIMHEHNIIYLDEGVKYAMSRLENSIKKGFFEGIDSIKQLPRDFEDSFSRIMACLGYTIIHNKILDLGCGSTGKTVESKEYKDKYEPWMCRSLYSIRAHSLAECNYQPEKTQIMGVDCGDLSKERFPHKELNLLEKNILINNFEKESFDLIYASMLFNSPELEKQITGKESNRDACEETSLKLKEILLPQIKTLLKPEGIFLYHGGGKELFSNEPEYISRFRNSEEVRDRFVPKERDYWGGQY